MLLDTAFVALRCYGPQQLSGANVGISEELELLGKICWLHSQGNASP